MLQHGTLPLQGDIGRITEVLHYDQESERGAASERVRDAAITVEQALGRGVDWGEAATAFQRGFAEALNLNLEVRELSAAESAEVDTWLNKRYANREWTQRV